MLQILLPSLELHIVFYACCILCRCDEYHQKALVVHGVIIRSHRQPMNQFVQTTLSLYQACANYSLKRGYYSNSLFLPFFPTIQVNLSDYSNDYYLLFNLKEAFISAVWCKTSKFVHESLLRELFSFPLGRGSQSNECGSKLSFIFWTVQFLFAGFGYLHA